MAVKFSLDFSGPDQIMPAVSGAQVKTATRLARLFRKLATGTKTGVTLRARNTASAATGTITLSTCLAGTVIEVNGVEFVAIASGTPDTTQGEFVISGTDAADATSLAAAINASTDARISGVVTASSTGASGVVTVTATAPGLLGNAVTIKTKGVCASGTATAAAVDADDTLTINGVTFTGIQQRATGTLTAATSVAGDTFSIRGYTFTGQAGAVTLGDLTFSVDTGDNETATSIAAQINGFAGLSGIVTATAATDTVTVRAVSAGTAGNAIALTGTATTLEASAATLEGGIAVANNQFDTSPGSTNTQVAADIARAINASSTALVSGVVVARSNAAVVTIRSKHVGAQGNWVTLASSDGTDLAVSAARLAGGTTTSSEGVQATATVTISGADGGNYTVLVNGVTTGNVTGSNGDDTATALSICNAINSLQDALVSESVKATVSAGVITITAIRGGLSGNAITLSATGTGATASLARLATGAVPTTVVPSGERLASGAETAFSLTY